MLYKYCILKFIFEYECALLTNIPSSSRWTTYLMVPQWSIVLQPKHLS